MEQRAMDKKSLIILLGLAGFIVIADNWVIAPILPAISESLNLDISRVGLLITAYMIPYGIFQIIFGPLADRFGKKQVITFSVLAFTVSTGICALGSSLMNLVIFRVLTGIFAASIIPVSLALIGDVFPFEERQQAIGTFMGISFLGQGLSMAIGGTIAFFLNWRGVFITYALLSLIPASLLIRNYKLLPSMKNKSGNIVKPYIKLITKSNSLYTYIIVIFDGMFIVGSFSFIGAYISKIHNYNYLIIGIIMTGFGLMSVIGGRLSGKVTNKIGAGRVLKIGLILATLADMFIYFLGTNIFILVISVTLLGLGFIFTHSTLLTRATTFAEKSRGSAMSLVAFCFMGGGGLGTAIGSKIIFLYGINTLFIIYGLFLLLTLGLSYVLIKEI